MANGSVTALSSWQGGESVSDSVAGGGHDRVG